MKKLEQVLNNMINDTRGEGGVAVKLFKNGSAWTPKAFLEYLKLTESGRDQLTCYAHINSGCLVLTKDFCQIHRYWITWRLWNDQGKEVRKYNRHEHQDQLERYMEKIQNDIIEEPRQECTDKPIRHIAEPVETRNEWRQANLKGIELKHLTRKLNLIYYKNSQEVELNHGDMLIDFEEKSIFSEDGNIVLLGVVAGNKMNWIQPNREIKKHIKSFGSIRLMAGWGQQAAVIRLALWLQAQPDLEQAIQTILELE